MLLTNTCSGQHVNLIIVQLLHVHTSMHTETDIHSPWPPPAHTDRTGTCMLASLISLLRTNNTNQVK